MTAVDLVVPVKPLHLAKSRLRSSRAVDRRVHEHLVLAITRDTLAAARAAPGVRRLVAICSDPAAAGVLRADGIEVIPDEPSAGLNPALRYGAALLRAGDPESVAGAMQADLPALRPAELAAAVTTFCRSDAARAFSPDRAGTGSTLLLAAPGVELDPRFGPGSAAAHTASGAVRLDGPWPTLRCDVDTEADLAEATHLGLGPHTRAVFAEQLRATR